DAREEDTPKIIVSNIYPLTEQQIQSLQISPNTSQFTEKQAAKKSVQKLYVKVSSINSDDAKAVKEILKNSTRGDIPVYFYEENTKKKLLSSRSMWINKDFKILEKLRFILGQDSVIMK